jgi:hypothetical protein
LAYTTQKHCSSVACVSIAPGTCLPNHSIAVSVYSCLWRTCCLAMDVIPLFVSWPLPRNKCFRAIHYQLLFLWLQSSCFEQICHNIFKSSHTGDLDPGLTVFGQGWFYFNWHIYVKWQVLNHREIHILCMKFHFLM